MNVIGQHKSSAVVIDFTSGRSVCDVTRSQKPSGRRLKVNKQVSTAGDVALVAKDRIRRLISRRFNVTAELACGVELTATNEMFWR